MIDAAEAIIIGARAESFRRTESAPQRAARLELARSAVGGAASGGGDSLHCFASLKFGVNLVWRRNLLAAQLGAGRGRSANA